MRLWPFRRESEKRASEEPATYEGMVTSALVRAAKGEDGEYANPEGLAAVEAASGLIGRCFAGAEVSGDRFGLVSAAVLETIGRELVRRGEAVFEIDGETSPRLVPAGTWDIRGGTDPATWFYRVDTFGASNHRTRVVPSAGVVHARINVDPVRPWLGRSPVRVAADTASTAAHAERSATGEARLPTGRLLPMPIADGKIREGFEASVRRGGLHVVRGHEYGQGREPSNRWDLNKFQPAPAESHIELRRDSARDVLGACGIPGVLFDARADGTATREAYRRLVFTTLQPWSRIVEAELRDKLDSPELALSFAGLHGADLATRGRALKQLTESGVSLAEAMAITGLSD